MTVVKGVLLVGVGGQGIILLSKILCAGLTELGYDVKMSEIHGMAQRGGVVTTHIRYGDKVHAPNIDVGEADVIVAFEKAEALRVLPYLRKGGTFVLDDYEIYPMPVLTGAVQYPHDAIEAIKAEIDDVRVIPASQTAKSLGNPRVQNTCLLGALVKVLGLDGIDWKECVANHVTPRTKDINLAAFSAGFEMAV